VRFGRDGGSMIASAKTLGVVAHGRDNNFNLIRMIAACGVLVSHCFPIALGGQAIEPLMRATRFSLGAFGVMAFFSISGFLISQSYDRSRSPSSFWAARALRLLPALFVALVVDAYVIGLWATTAPKLAYFFKPYTATFVLSNVSMLWDQYALWGVFRDNPFPTWVNGSLWTLRYEVICYAATMLCGFIGLYRERLFPLFLAVFLAWYVPARITGGDGLIVTASPVYLAPFFAAGMTLYIYRRWIPLNWLIAALGVVLCILMRRTPVYFEFLVVTCAYTTMCLAFARSPFLLRYNRLGDYSYGIYIYAFPVQQAIVHFLKPISPFGLTALAFPITIALAVVSWHFIERPTLSMKRIFRRREAALSAPPLAVAPET